MPRTTCSMLLLACLMAFHATDASAQGANPTRVVVDFDDLATGTLVSNEYANRGVVFSGSGWPTGLIQTEPDFGTFFFGNSQPNFLLVGVGYLTAAFVNPSNGSPTMVSNLSIRMGDSDPAAELIGVTAFDIAGNVVYSEVVHLVDKGATIHVPNRVAEIRLFGISAFPTTGFAIDDLSYTLLPNR